MGIVNLLKGNRKKVGEDLSRTGRAQFVSAETYACYRLMRELAVRHVEGDVLDAGAAFLEWKRLLSELGKTYTSLDIESRIKGLDYTGDLKNLKDLLADASYDTVFAKQVLEHIPDVGSAMAEAWRILRPGGKFVLSTPFMFMLHEEPHDYHRFSRHGLSYHLETAGFEVVLIREYGNYFTMCLHICSYIFLSLFWTLPIVRWPAYQLNKLFLVLLPLCLLGASRLSPVGYVAVGRKPD